LKPTANHPFLVVGKGWATISGKDELGMGAGRLELGDHVYVADSNNELTKVEVVDIIPIEGNFLTYNLIDMKYGTFLAGGVVVHNSEMTNNQPEEGYHPDHTDQPEPGTQTICFLPETLIRIADGTPKRIDEISIGDLVKVYNEEKHLIEIAPVKLINKVYHDNVYELYLADGKVLKPTANHPFLVVGKGWATISGNDELGMGAGKLEVGDHVYVADKENNLNEVEVVNIVPVPGTFLTYSILDDKHGTFLAQDVVVHNSYKKFK